MADDKDQRFEKLFAYYGAVVHYFIRLNFSSDEARDLAQEVFVRVYEHMDAWREDAHWSYLKTAAQRLAANTIRDRKAAKRNAIVVSDEALLGLHDDKVIPADIQLGKKDEVARLYETVKLLKPDLRSCVLYWLEGYSYHEMEKMLGISAAALKSRLHEARRQLKDLLGEEPVGFGGES